MMPNLMAAPEGETERRRAIARHLVDRLARETNLTASLLAGSAAQGTSDQHSDIDLLNYYEVLPEAAAFDAVLIGMGADRVGDIGAPGREGFSASYRLDGIEVQTGGQLIALLEQRLERIAAGEVDWINAKIAQGLLEGTPLYGANLIRRWQERVRYPEALRKREVEANLGFFPIWKLDHHLQARDAELFRRQMLLDGAFRVLAVLSAVNRLYFTTFQFKRAGAHVERMPLKPERLKERLDRIANAAPPDASEELRILVEDTKAIVSAEMPEVDVTVVWNPIPDP
jgi:hypothetical protein